MKIFGLLGRDGMSICYIDTRNENSYYKLRSGMMNCIYNSSWQCLTHPVHTGLVA